jgi:hypothetical protein
LQEKIFSAAVEENESILEFLEKRSYVKIPLSVNSLGHFEVDAKLNGIDAKFIIDTGASGTVIDETSSSDFNLLLLTQSEDKAAGLGTNTLQVTKSAGNEIILDGFRIENWEVGIINLSHVNEALSARGAKIVNGVIGADIMNRFSAVIDYGDKALYLKSIVAGKQ